jgi:hypothetical protein
MNMTIELGPLSEEFAGAKLGDKRRTKRLQQIVDSAARSPSSSLPVQAGSDGALEGTYRLLSNEHVEAADVLAAHVERTVDRAAASGTVLVIHDTTTFEFSGEVQREGLGPLRGKGQGFFAHFSLAVGVDGQPLGTVALRAWTRSHEGKGGKRTIRELQDDDDRESLRWHDAVTEVGERLYGRATAIHVMDREADSFELFAHLLEGEQRFVVRLAQDRNLEVKARRQPKGPKLYKAMADADLFLERDVQLSRRTGKKRGPTSERIHPARAPRKARLHVRARPLRVARSQHLPHYLPDALELGFVEVTEPNPPPGETPVVWRLVTTEPIDTAEQVARVIDIYRQRWQVEEFFKALKTGCAFEKRQLESMQTLGVALAIFSSVAWRLLLLRWMERHASKQPATMVLTETQLAVLNAVRIREGRPLPQEPTGREVLLAIAALGGHIRNNGRPGWQVLGRGFDSLLLLELGWLAAQDRPHGRYPESRDQ